MTNEQMDTQTGNGDFIGTFVGRGSNSNHNDAALEKSAGFFWKISSP